MRSSRDRLQRRARAQDVVSWVIICYRDITDTSRYIGFRCTQDDLMFVYIVEGSPKCLVNIYRYTARVSFLASQKSFPSFLLGSFPGRLAKLGPPPRRRHLSVSPRGAWLSGPRGQPVGTLLRDIRGASAPISTFKVHTLGIFHIYHTVSTSFQIDTER